MPIRKQYYGVCSRCYECQDLPHSTTKKEAAKRLRHDWQWEKRSDEGWICRTCRLEESGTEPES